MNSAIILAGGDGRRLGRPKQFLSLAGKPMLHRTVEAFLSVPELDEIVVALGPAFYPDHRKDWPGSKVKVVPAGETRLESLRKALKATSSRTGLLAVHDGARPLVSPALIRKCLEEAKRHGAAVPAVPVKDTIKETRAEGKERELWIARTPDRSRLWAAQTPQCYRKEILLEALRRHGGLREATDESQLVEALGVDIRIVSSSYENLKVTTKEDLAFAEALLSRSKAFRTGFGYDIHRLVPDRPLWLGGARIPHDKGLLGHSDGDVLLHAVGDSLLGAAALGDIGRYFPPEEKKWKGISSRDILKKVLALLRSRQARVENLDVTLVAQEPRLSPHYEKIHKSLCGILKVPAGRVNLKAKTREGLGEIGRGEAVACYAVAAVEIFESIC